MTVPGTPLATFQLAASQAAPIGDVTVTVTGTSGTLTHTATFSLVVTQAAAFAIEVSPASLWLTPASVATAQISVTTSPGTSPELWLNVSGPPESTTKISTRAPQGLLTPTNPLSFVVTAKALAQPLQDFPVTITASDNSGNSSLVILPLTVTVPFSSNAAPTRSTFVRTDKSPTGMVYDPFRKLLFVSVEILNEVQVISTIDGHEVASIPVSFPAGIDEAADGSAVYVVSPYFGGITTIDPNSLAVVGHAAVPASVSGTTQPLTFFQVATLSTGKVVLYITYASTMPLLIWDPREGTFGQFEVPSGSSVGLISRSADHSKLLGYAGPLGTGFLYDATTDSYLGPPPAIGAAPAVTSDGSQVASATYQNGTLVLAFYDANLNLVGSLPFGAFYVNGTFPKLIYSVDGEHLYVIPD